MKGPNLGCTGSPLDHCPFQRLSAGNLHCKITPFGLRNLSLSNHVMGGVFHGQDGLVNIFIISGNPALRILV